jgi:hypothetical protein
MAAAQSHHGRGKGSADPAPLSPPEPCVQGLGRSLGVEGLGFGGWGSGFRVWGLALNVSGLGSEVGNKRDSGRVRDQRHRLLLMNCGRRGWVVGFRVCGSGLQGLGFRVLGLGSMDGRLHTP